MARKLGLHSGGERSHHSTGTTLGILPDLRTRTGNEARRFTASERSGWRAAQSGMDSAVYRRKHVRLAR
jgi:hypothetical protein